MDLIEVIILDDIGVDLDIEELLEQYSKLYRELVEEYKDFYRAGTGVKTNKYHSPTMNLAYNYIEHDDFKRVAKEPSRGYTRYGMVKSEPISYVYYLSVWSIVCERLQALYDNKFTIKFDHRHKDRKNNDFDGYLVCFKNSYYWRRRNLPNNQRY